MFMIFLLQDVLCLNFYHTTQTFNDPERQDSRKYYEKLDNAGNQYSPVITMFSTLSKGEITNLATFNLSSAKALNLLTSRVFH